VSEVIHTPGITFLGPIPAELQPGFSFVGALTTNAVHPEEGLSLIRLLSSPEFSDVVLKAGLIPEAKR